VKLIVFDLDGTLVEFNIPVEEIKAALGIEGSILEEIMWRDDGWRCLEVLESHEIECARRSRLYPGVRDLLDFLGDNGVHTALYTRNSMKSVKINLQRHNLKFDFIFTREDDIKPSPYPIIHVMDEVRAKEDEVALVGDYYFDYLTAKNAGIEFWLYESEKAREAVRKFGFVPDHSFKSYHSLMDFLERRMNGH